MEDDTEKSVEMAVGMIEKSSGLGIIMSIFDETPFEFWLLFKLYLMFISSGVPL